MTPTGIKEVLHAALDLQKRGETVVIATVVANRTDAGIKPGVRLLVFGEGESIGSVSPGLDAVLIDDAKTFLAGGKSQVQSYRVNREEVRMVGLEGGDIDVFFEVFPRSPRLVVVGAGHIAAPLVKIAKLLEFEVYVLDDRPEYANSVRFPDADHIVVGPYRESLASIPIHADTFVVLVTRGHVHDQACLEQVIDSDVTYIGMIGSKRRVRTVMKHAAERGVALDRLQRVYAPVGLDIGSHTPAEIAVAIAAEIINVRGGGRAPSLALGERLRV